MPSPTAEGSTTYNITGTGNAAISITAYQTSTSQGGSVTVANVTNITAYNTVTGTPGADGSTGPTGATGATGPTGPTGAAATVAVGSTTTGAAGSSASVTNSGSSSAAVLNFTIPKGDTGATGATGPQGPAGANGTNGTNGAVWYEGASAPGTTHNNGDFYLNTTNGDVYEQAAGAWGSPVGNIRGPAGTGSGDMLKSVYDPANKSAQLAADSQVVHNTGAETVAGVKTFSSAPVVPSNSFSETAVIGLTADLASKANDSAVVHLAGAESISGAKSFAQNTLILIGATNGITKLNGSAATGANITLTLPGVASDTLVSLTASQILTNKNLTNATNTFPTFNQNTTGSAATLTTPRNIDGQAFNGSADITVIAPGTHVATSKTTPVDADEVPIADSAATFGLKKLTWANLKATLKSYFDTIYTLTNLGGVPTGRTVNGHALSANVTVTGDDVLPTQTGNSGKFLTTNGSTSSWGTPAGGGSGLPAIVVAASDAPSEWTAAADYTCDGTADDVQIQSAITAAQVAGNPILLSPGTFNISTTILIAGTNNPDTGFHITIQGAGMTTTNLNTAANVDCMKVYNTAKVNLWDFGIIVATGSGNGLVSVASASANRRSFFWSSFRNLLVTGDWAGTSTGWAFKLGSPFRSTFDNIESGGMKNGMQIYSEYSDFNPGDCAFNRMFMEIIGAGGVAYNIQSPTGNGVMNQMTFNMIEAFANSGTSTGILMDGAGQGSSWNRFNGVNLEQFATLVDIQNAEGNDFRFNYIEATSGGTVFKCGTTAGNNRFQADYVYANSAQTLINDGNTSAHGPNRFENIKMYADTSASMTITKVASTIINGSVVEGTGTVGAEFTKPFVRLAVGTSAPASPSTGDLWVDTN